MKEINLTRRKLVSLFEDTEACAKTIDLVYVTDADPGITREYRNGEFLYCYNNKPVADELTLLRIRKLAVPPAWRNVWICAKENGHLQATGLDARNRKQYRYHSLWNILRQQTKFSHLYEFGKALPAIRQKIDEHLHLAGLPPEKVLAAIVSIIQMTGIRTGNSQYEKLYGSFGLTTLKDKHVSLTGNTVQFHFMGKKGVQHNISLKDRRLARIVKNCRDLPGKELFQYLDADGNRHSVDSGMLNDYIRDISGGRFTAKDFRTWEGTLHALEAFRKRECEEEGDRKKSMIAAIDEVAGKLGNTRTVCRNYYIHPVIINHFSNATLSRYFNGVNTGNSSYNAEELALMQILEDERKVTIPLD